MGCSHRMKRPLQQRVHGCQDASNKLLPAISHNAMDFSRWYLAWIYVKIVVDNIKIWLNARASTATHDLRRCFRPLHAKRKTDVIWDEFALSIVKHPIQPLTMGQANDQPWWICRSFSSPCTLIGFIVLDGDEQVLQNRETWKIAKSYVSKVDERSWNLNRSAKKVSTPKLNQLRTTATLYCLNRRINASIHFALWAKIDWLPICN